jgi:hypothetical protein
MNIINNDPFSPKGFLLQHRYIQNIYWLDPVSAIALSGEYEAYVFSLLTKVCDTCSGSSILSAQKEIFEEGNNRIGVNCFVLNRYSHNDVANMVQQLKIDFPVHIASPMMSNAWINLINKYNEAALNNILIFIDKNGNIQDVADSFCNCLAEAIKSIREFINKDLGNLR